jgi:RNA polymerase sigma-70 factor, ECF subfamily
MWSSRATGLDGTALPHPRERADDEHRAPARAGAAVTSFRAGFETLFNEHAEFIYRTAYGVTGRHEDAEDVLQSVFLRLLRRDLSADATRNPKAYLYRAAVNVSLDIIRSRRRTVTTTVDELPDTPAPDDSADDERHRFLYQAIADLKPEAAQILILRYVHDKSDADIARMLGLSRGAIALRLFRSRARLKTLLAARLGVTS